MNEPFDEIGLQRLLDGSMPEEEQLAFLDYVDQQPESWRTVALAFIEEQTLRRAMPRHRIMASHPKTIITTVYSRL